MTFVRPPIEPEPPDTSSLEGRASLGLKGIAVLNGFGVILAFFPPPVPPARLLSLSFNLASALLVLLLLLEARGLDRLRPWAFAAVRPLLVVIGLVGVYQLVVAILDERIRLPFDIAIVAWSFLAGSHETDRVRPGPRSLGIAGAAIGLSAAMLFAKPIFDWGGALDVRPEAIHVSMSVDCGAVKADGNVPDAVTITYDWSWTASSPLPDGLDAIVVGWTGDDGEGRPLYLLGPTPDIVPGVYSGRRGYPSSDMTGEAAKETRGWWHWGVELDERGYAPGHLVVELVRGQPFAPDPAPLLVKASYVHLGIWREDVASVTCTW